MAEALFEKTGQDAKERLAIYKNLAGQWDSITITK
jgi:hypothetical protein